MERKRNMIHGLKCLPEFYSAVCLGVKTFEIRRDDRDFQVGDTLMIQEYDADMNKYTGRYIFVRVQYILRDKAYCKDGFCIMSVCLK